MFNCLCWEVVVIKGDVKVISSNKCCFRIKIKIRRCVDKNVVEFVF